MASTPTASPERCASRFRIAFVTDVGGLRSATDQDGWRGVRNAAVALPCASAELIAASAPSAYGRNLQAAVDHRADLVIAASFLLTDAVAEAAHVHPTVHFALVDPIVPPRLPNVAVVSFREDQSAFLAGALAAMISGTGVIAGVYGPGGSLDAIHRRGFEHGAQAVNHAIKVFGADQPASDGQPYANPAWGAAEARAFLDQRADVIFGAGGETGLGALAAAGQTGRWCIGLQEAVADQAASQCLIAAMTKSIDKGVEAVILETAHGTWTTSHAFGIAEGAVGLDLLPGTAISPAVRQRLAAISDALDSGTLSTGV